MSAVAISLDSLNEAQRSALATAMVEYPFLSDSDIIFLASATAEDCAAVLATYKQAAVAPTASFWDTLVMVVGVIATVAGVVSGISGGVQSLYALKSL